MVCKTRRKRHNIKAESLFMGDFFREEAALQVIKYIERCGTNEGYLIIFDKSSEVSWDEKIYRNSAERGCRIIPVWGM